MKLEDIVVKSGKIKPFKAGKEYYVNSTDEYQYYLLCSFNKRNYISGILILQTKKCIKEMQKVGTNRC